MATITRIDLPSHAREALPEADYADSFRTTSPAFFTAEEWARSAFERPSTRHLATQQAVWRAVLQLRLGSLRDRDRVAGWEVVEQEPDRLVLRARSWHLDARLIFVSGPSEGEVTTLVRFRNPAGRAVWSAVGAVHRNAVPGILGAARKRLTRD